MSRGLLLALLVFPALAGDPPPLRIAVSPGEDFTLSRAVREAHDTTQPVEITLAPGTYPPLDIDRTFPRPVTIRAADIDDPPVLSAGTRITGWKNLDGTWQASLDQRMVVALWVNDQVRPRARKPDRDTWRIDAAAPDRRSGFSWKADTPVPTIRDLDHLDVVFYHDWSISRVPVEALDHGQRQLVTRFPIGPHAPHYDIDHFEKHPRWFLEGAYDLMDRPGEWHFDRRRRQLSYLAKPGEDRGETAVIVPASGHALVVRGTPDEPVTGLTFRHVRFAHAAWSPQGGRYAAGQASFHEDGQSHTRTAVTAAVILDHARGIRFEACTFGPSSGTGLWVRSGCEDVTVRGCTFSELGGNGLMIGEPGNPEHLTREVLLEESTVTRCGQRFFGAVGVWIGMAADCAIRRNHLLDLPYTGVSVGWRWNPKPSPCGGHRIEENHIHHVMQVLSDGGGIYTLGRQPGTVLAHNHIHHVAVNAGRAESNGIFMDEGTTDLRVEGNHIHDITRSPIRFHKAGRNTLRGNRLEPAPGIPALRFNNTPEENIVVE